MGADEGTNAPQVHLEANAHGGSTVNMAGRDAHLHFVDGMRERVRSSATVVGECPYPGLAAFTVEQADWFFGRDVVVADLLALLDRRTRDGGIQIVVAPSGAGKSSLLQAGLLPRLARAAVPGSDRWSAVVFTPTAEPMAELTRCIGSPTRRVENGRAVVVVDQFEELFTLCSEEDQRREFVSRLAEIAGNPSAALVVVAVRADFHAACADHEPLRAALQDAPLVLGPMSEDELREAIRYPARTVGLDVEPGLVELLVRDLGATLPVQAGRLPLLAHVLRLCWQQRNGSTLTVAGYRDTGGIRHAIGTTADRTFAALDERGRSDARRLFLRLVRVGDRTDDTRRRLTRAEVADLAPVVDAFTRARLLTADKSTVEIAHEALVHSWPLLRRWLDSDRAGRLVHQELEEAAVAWRQAYGDASRLYRGNRLESALQLESSEDLSDVARDFLAASASAVRRTARRRRAVVATLAALALVTSSAAVLSSYREGKALVQRDLAVHNRVLSEIDQLHATDVSLAARLSVAAHRMRSGDDTYTRVLGAAHTPLSTSLSGHSDVIRQVAVSPDGRMLASVAGDSTVRIWDAAHRAPLDDHVRLPVSARSLAFGPDNRTLVTGGNDGVELWDFSDPASVKFLQHPGRHGEAVDVVAFSPDGRTLATGGSGGVWLWDLPGTTSPATPPQQLLRDGSVQSLAFTQDGRTLVGSGGGAVVQLWNLSDPVRAEPWGQPLATGHLDAVHSVAVSPDGRTLATGSGDSTFRLWDITDPAHPTYLNEGHHGYSATAAVSVRFSPDGRALASGSGDSRVRLWNVVEPASITPLGEPLTGHTDAVTSVAFGRDGTSLVTGSLDRTVRVWDLPSTRVLAHSGTVTSVAHHPTGKLLATAGGDATIRLWDVTDLTRAVPLGEPLTGHTGAVSSLAFNRAGNVMASVGHDGTARLWNLADPARPQALSSWQAHTGAVNAVAFRGDGDVLATAGADQTVRLWLLADHRRPGPPLQTLQGHKSTVNAVAFSPNGHKLVTGGGDQAIQLWDVSVLPGARRLNSSSAGHANAVLAVGFSPDGRVLATGSADSTVRLWDVDEVEGITPWALEPLDPPLVGHSSPVQALTFSPDGTLLATTAGDSTARLWRVSGHTPLGGPLTGQSAAARAVSFNPDGHTLVTGGRDGAVRLWPLDLKRTTDRVCTVTVGALTELEWHRYVGNEVPYDASC